MNKIRASDLVPDSVLMASAIVDILFIEQYVRESIISYCEVHDFITIQACPYKVKFTDEELANEIDLIDSDVVLLPIGYASGHDDVIFLSDVQRLTKKNTTLFDDLNVWEIMYVLAKSNSFFGTSLHGVITAMSFGIPHFCINSDIKKITSFLETWSVSPFYKAIEITAIKDVVTDMKDHNNNELLQKVHSAQKIIFESLNKITNLL